MFLSIIIPVYNVEKYLEECLLSVYNQDLSYEEYEVIVINDGSSDQSVNVIESFIKKNQYPNFKYFSKDNEGLSVTRNRGLRVAKGDYVWFVDSDDWISPNSLYFLKEYTIKRLPDIVALTTTLYRGDEVRKVDRMISEKSYLEGEKLFYKSWKFPYSGAQFYLFNRNWLKTNGLKFLEKVYYEDILFMPMALNKGRNCISLSKPIYNYRLRENSITTVDISERHIESLFTIISAYLQELSHNNSNMLSNMLGRLILRINSMIREITDDKLLKQISINYSKLPFLGKYVVRGKSLRNIIGWIVVNIKIKSILRK